MATVLKYRPPARSKTPLPESLRLLVTPFPLLLLSLLLLLIVFLVGVGLRFIPWQQSVVGKGKVIVLSPMERPQNLEAQIPGRLMRWRVFEGQAVAAGEVVAELADIDAKFLDTEQIKRLESLKGTLIAKRAAARTRVAALEGQLAALSGSRRAALPAAEQKTRQAGDRLQATEQARQAAEQNVRTAALNLTRLRVLHSKGLRSRRDLEVAELESVRARTELERADASLAAAGRDIPVARLEREKISFDTTAGLDSVRASLGSAYESIATTEGDLWKLEVEIRNLRVRNEQRVVRAPSAGRVVRLLKVGAGATVKAGDVLAVLAPDTKDRAVELYLSGNDAPLAAVGRPVRLQFSGWPSVQFSGWPSVAVGTFSGRIAVIDAVDDGIGQYRILVVPDKTRSRDEAWPAPELLRPGVETAGWILLDTVPLGFELWRQFNGFQPTVQAQPVKLKPKK